MKHPTRLGIAALATASTFGFLASPASAAHGDSFYEGYEGQLTELNDTGLTGTVDVDLLAGNRAAISIEVTGASAMLPHAMHIHGTLTEDNVCPPMSADTDEDGFVSVLEGVPFYGGIQASLTTEGGTGGEDALALDRFPVADADGAFSYTRVIDLPEDVGTYLGNLHVVVHGIDINENGEYDFDAGPSSLTDAAPFEATVPAGCGSLDFAGINLPPQYRDMDVDSNEGFVIRAYAALLGRAPDAAGFEYWVNDLDTGGRNYSQLLAAFANEPEFQDRFGDLINGDRETWVKFVYQSVLGRLPDSQGEAYWTTGDGASVSNRALVLFFADSPEYRANFG